MVIFKSRFLNDGGGDDNDGGDDNIPNSGPGLILINLLNY